MKFKASFIIICLAFSLMVIAPYEISEAVSGQEGIVINEVMYDPVIPEVEGEWVELFNNGSTTVNLMNWSLTDQDGTGDDFIFPNLDFPQNTYIVLHTGSGTNETDFADNVAHLYMWKSSGMWDTYGDDVLLKNETGYGIDYIAYDTEGNIDPCPLELAWDELNWWIDSPGNSLSLQPNGLDSDSGLSWEESDPTPGSHNAHLNDAPPNINWVAHDPLNPDSQEGVSITANITDEYDLVSVTLYYTINGTGSYTVPMNQFGTNFTAQIPAMAHGTAIEYHVMATDDAQQNTSSQQCSYASSDSQVQLVINEFLADPGSDWNDDGYIDSDDEWIELYNPGDTIVNIGGWKIDDVLGPTGSSDPYSIPLGPAVPPLGFLVLYGSETGILLNNNGDNVTLLDEEYTIVDIQSYSSSANDTARGRFPDGTETWEGFLLPTPDSKNMYTVDTLDNLSQIKINELLPRPKYTYATEWIELHNAGDDPVRLDGCYLDDVMDSGKKPYQIPLNTTLDAGEFWMYSGNLGLNNDGDSVNLVYVDGSTVIDGFNYDSSEYDISYGRGFDSQDIWASFSVPTPLAANTPLQWPDAHESTIIISELFYKAPDMYEFLALYNPSGQDVDISNWRISDGTVSYSGTALFPQGTHIPRQSLIYIAHNASIFHHITGSYPEFECVNSLESIPDLVCRDVPSFSNQGDEVLLLDGFGHELDIVSYGDSEYEGPGWDGVPAQDVTKGELLIRNHDESGTGFSDTNTSTDWEHMRHHKLGQSDFTTETMAINGNITAFASPDSSFQTIEMEIEAAESSIYLSLYQFTNWRLAQRVLDRLNDSVAVNILMEGGPAGEWDEQQQYILQKIVEYGGEVRFMVYNSTLGSRYRYIHAKYAIIDNNSVIISSENWKDTGIPVNNTFGNRGWGIIIRDSATAEYFLKVFSADWNSITYDIIPFTPDDPKYGNASLGFEPDDWVEDGYYDPVFPSMTIKDDITVTCVISPDTLTEQNDQILADIDSAIETIYVEQLDLSMNWNENEIEYDNLYFQALIRAAEQRHVDVKILLSSIYTSPDDPGLDNYDTCLYINDYAANHNISDHLEARLVDYDRLGISKIHNKGMIVDGNKTLISSINWVRNSVTQNREVGVIIENKDVAEYFTQLFLWDWNEPPEADAGEDMTATTAQDISFNDLSIDSDDNIIMYYWEFDDGTNSTKQNPVHHFSEPGIYDVKLTVSDGQYTDSTGLTVIVLQGQEDDIGDISPAISTLLLVTFISIIVVIIIFVRKMRLKYI
jgi:phosphatidylserine/phosphatidylglycerophosphate/cardiolipin synthase-like enzyme